MSLSNEFPQALDTIEELRQKGIKDNIIRRALLGSGFKPRIGKQQDLTFTQAVTKNIVDASTPISDALAKVPVIGGVLEAFSRPLGIFTEVLDLPQDLATAAISPDEGGFKQTLARGKDPSEALGIENPIGAFAADVILDPINLITGANIAKASKLIKGIEQAPAAGKLAKLSISTPEQAAAKPASKVFQIDDFTEGIPVVNTPTAEKVGAAFTELVAKGRREYYKPKDGIRFYTQVIGAINDGQISLKDLATKSGLKEVDVIEDVVRAFEGASDIGRKLNEFKQLSDQVKVFARSKGLPPEAEALLRQTNAIEPESLFSRFYGSIVNTLWRGSLTSQYSTAARNAISQGGRVGLDVLQNAMDSMIQSIPGIQRKAHFSDSFNTVLRLFSKNKDVTNKILDKFPEYQKILQQNLLSDINIASGGTKAEKGVQAWTRAINTANIFQENIFRRAIFQGELQRLIPDLQNIIAQNRIGDISKDALKKAADKALELTWANSPKSKIAQSFIKFVNSVPGGTIAVPFPRFMMNSMKFFWDFSPTGALKLFKPGSAGEWAKILKGDTGVLSRAVLGSGMLGAGWQLRNSEHAGEKWYEMKAGGRVFDIRPFNPFAAYVFIADLAKRQRDGTLTNLKTSDLLQGILSTNMRAGTGLFIADELMGAIAGIKSGEKFEQKAQEFVGQFGRGFFLPLQQITDVIAEFDESLRVQRDTRTEPLFGPIKSTIPGLAQTLPERESPTRAATPEIVSPLFKQLTGLRAIQEKNPAEKELDRLGFESREILSSTGNREADRLMAKNLGPLIETSLVRYIKSEPYQRLSDVQKGALLRRYMIKLRAVAKRRSIGENPALFRQLAKERAPLRERLARE